MHRHSLLIGLSFLFQTAALADASPIATTAASDRTLTAIGPEDAASLQARIEDAAARGLPQITVSPGIYRLPVQGQWHLQFRNLRNLEIDALGATFILEDPHANGIGFFGCHHVTVRGVRILRARPAFSQATIRGIDLAGNSVDIQVDKGYPDDLENRADFPTFWAGIFDKAGKMLGVMRAKTPPEIERLPSGLFRVHLSDSLAGIQKSLGIPVTPGLRLGWRGPVYDDFHLADCEDMKFIDVTVTGGSGMVFHELGGAGGNQYLHCTVTYPPMPEGAEAKPLFATCADGLHSHDVMKGPLIDHCLFEGIGDDGIAVHGTYAMAAEVSGRRLVAWVFHETRDKLFCHPGELLRFYDAKGLFVGEAKVLSSRALEGYLPSFRPNSVYRDFQKPEGDFFVEVMLDRPVGAMVAGGLISNVDRMGNGYVIRDCVIRQSSARGVMAKASDGLIEGCTFEDLARAGVEFMSEMEVWSEADYSRNVIVRHNVFRRVSENRQSGYLRHPGALTIFNFRALDPNPDLSVRRGAYVPSPGGHRHIIVEGNSFEDVDGPNLIVTSAEDVVIRDNHFVHPMWRDKSLGVEKGIDTGALLWFTQSAGLLLSGNEVTEPGPFLQHPVTATPTAQGAGFVTGIRVAATTVKK